MGSGKDGSYSQTLAGICDDLLSLIVYLRETGDIEDANAFYDRAVELFADMEGKARQLKVPEADVRDTKYALVAIIDENVGWASRLEQEFFSRNVAGEEFFTRLEEIKKTKGRNELLEIYYICLTLGFEGKYFRSPERLQEYIQELQETLNLKAAARLSPHGEITQSAIKRRRVGIPAWTPWVVAAVCLVIVVGVVIFLRGRVDGLASSVVSRIQGLLK